jgi:excisionase family DNA binding protein
MIWDNEVTIWVMRVTYKMPLMDSYFTVAQAAKELGVTRKTISRWLADGKFPAEKVGRERLIKKKDLHEFHYLKHVKAVAERITELYEATIKDYLREKGRFPEGKALELVPLEDYVFELPDEDQAEIRNRFTPILQDIFKDSSQKFGGLPIENAGKATGRKRKKKAK